MRRSVIVRSVVALGLAGLPLFAQERSRVPRERHSHDEAFKMADAYIVSNLQESLGLTDEQFVKLLPLVKKLQTDRRELALRRKRALSDMHRMLENGSGTEAQLGELMEQLRGAEDAEPATIRRDFEAIDAVLTTVQQAKYRVLEAKLEQRIREAIVRARQERSEDRAQREQ